jgi:hypothetical protein
MVMTHLTDVADRIDRSNSPRGGGEERELDYLSKEQQWLSEPLENLLLRITCRVGFYCSRGHLSLTQAYDAVFHTK